MKGVSCSSPFLHQQIKKMLVVPPSATRPPVCCLASNPPKHPKFCLQQGKKWRREGRWEGGGWEERVDPCPGTFGAHLVEFFGRGMPGSAMQGSPLPLDQHPGVLPVTSAHRGDPGQLPELQVSQPRARSSLAAAQLSQLHKSVRAGDAALRERRCRLIETESPLTCHSHHLPGLFCCRCSHSGKGNEAVWGSGGCSERLLGGDERGESCRARVCLFSPHTTVFPCHILVSPALWDITSLILVFSSSLHDSGAGVGSSKAEKSLWWGATTISHPFSPSQAARDLLLPLIPPVPSGLSSGGAVGASPLALGCFWKP